MNYLETLNYIHSLGNFSKVASLERIKEVLNKLKNPQNSFKAIHIAGTNGKGSVSSMISNVFTLAGFKTALFVSPFIVNFRERIQVNGEYISEEDLVRFSQEVIDTKVDLTEFEFKVFSMKLDGYSFEEIANTLDKDVKSLYNTFHRVKGKVKKIIGNDNYR